MRHFIIFAALSSVLVVGLSTGCATDQRTRPDDMSADEHKKQAARERDTAAKEEARYDPTARRQNDTNLYEGSGGVPGVDDVYWDKDDYNPTEFHRGLAQERRTLAVAHEKAAFALESFEEFSCHSFPSSTRSSCPMLGSVKSIEDIPSGVRIRLADGILQKAVVEHIRCHFAYGRARGYEGMETCPLYLPGLKVTSSDAYFDLTITNEALVSDLRTRARMHLPSL